jgi:crotonobetainyl-CoA:carnitine CoA-transferase CaiB-like acyl-CoA transferase
MTASLLAGVRVLELGEGVAGPLAASILGDMGAEVIKLERPSWDWARTSGGPLGDDSSACFVAMNRNKRDIGLDLRYASALRVAAQLVATSDVVISNFRPGVMDRMGLGYSHCTQANSAIVYCTISAYGDRGRYRDVPGSDTVLQAMSGIMESVGEQKGPPLRVGFPLIDSCSALFAVQGIVAALYRRGSSDVGARLDISLLNTALALQALPLTEYLLDGILPTRLGNQNAALCPAGAFRARDNRYLSIVTLRDRHWRDLCAVLGRPELIEDGRFDDNARRIAHRGELNTILEAAFSQLDQAEWLTRLQTADVPCAPVNTFADIIGDPDLVESTPISTTTVPGSGSARTIGNPLKVDGEFLRLGAPPPAPGQHTVEILREIGLDDAQIHDMLSDGGAFTAKDNPNA